MIKRVKKWLGIDGVRAEIDIHSPARLDDRLLKGVITMTTKDHQTIDKMHFRLIERYARGRGKTKLIDEYVLGEEWHHDTIHLGVEYQERLQFALPFQPMASKMDEIQSKNIITNSIVKAAKLLKNVKSTYRLEVELFVKNRAINPVVSQEVTFI